MITILSAMWGKFSPHAWIEVELGQKGGKGKQQLPATVITTFAPISLISPTLLEHRGGNCTENKSALCGSPSPAALTPARHNWGNLGFYLPKYLLPQIIIFLPNFHAGRRQELLKLIKFLSLFWALKCCLLFR